MDNAWGIVRCIIDLVRKQKDGKYLIVKDPNKPVIRLTLLPKNLFLQFVHDVNFWERIIWTLIGFIGYAGPNEELLLCLWSSFCRKLSHLRSVLYGEIIKLKLCPPCNWVEMTCISVRNLATVHTNIATHFCLFNTQSTSICEHLLSRLDTLLLVKIYQDRNMH